MRSTTPHIGAEPSVGPKTVVVGFPRVVVECLLALTERARGGAAAVEGINFVQVFNGMGFVYNFLLFIFKCLLRSRSCLVCRSREDSKEEHSHQMQCSNP